jgi:hypothetical protein
VEFTGLFLEGDRAIVEEGLIDSESNIFSSEGCYNFIRKQQTSTLHLVNGPSRMPEMTLCALLLTAYLIHAPL